jgi:hypothetical protein
MDRPSLYDEDVYAWAQQQADALRRLAQTRPDLPNELDWEHVAEEIEDVGKSELHRVRSFVRLILVHLIKAASAPQSRSLAKWRGEIAGFRHDLLASLTRSMEPKVDMDVQWRLARSKAEGELEEQGDRVLDHLDETCPFNLEDLGGDGFDFDSAVDRLRAAQ